MSIICLHLLTMMCLRQLQLQRGEQEPVPIMQGIEEVAPVSTTVNSRRRTRKISGHIRESIIAHGLTSPSILGLEAVIEQQLDEIFPFEVSHDWLLQEEENMAQLVAYASKDIDNIMYYHDAMSQPDAIEFARVIIKEINGHVENGDWELIPRHTSPEGVIPVPSVWPM